MAGLPPVSEKEFQRQLLQYARLCGWRVYHTRDSRGSQAGFPDLVLTRGGRLIFAELKSARGKVRPEQSDWLDALRAAGQVVYLWRPEDWSEIGRILL